MASKSTKKLKKTTNPTESSNYSLHSFNKEINEAVHEIVFTAASIDSPNDRVRVVEWVRRLLNFDKKNLEETKSHNEYLQYLRIGLQTKPVYLYAPFKELPPFGKLVPLAEVLCNQMADQCPNLPRTGPLHPMVCHKSADGCAVINISKSPNGGVYCYMSVSTDPVRAELPDYY